MSLDVYLYHTEDFRGELYEANITHNLGGMAAVADLYKPLWRPEELNIIKAEQLIPYLEVGLEKLRNLDDETIEKHTPSNGLGSYDGLLRFTENYLVACIEFPDAYIDASR